MQGTTGSGYGYPHGKDKARERALRAIDRQNARDARTTKQQLALIGTRRGASAKEVLRLHEERKAIAEARENAQ